MQRSSSMTRVADEFYKNLLPKSSSSSSSSAATGDVASDVNLPVYNNYSYNYSPTSHAGKKDKSRLRSAENAVHLIPLVLLLCAVILWFFSSNPVDVVNKKPGAVDKVEASKVVGGTDIDGTQNNLLPHVEVEDVDLLHHHLHHHRHRHHHHQVSGRKPTI